MPVKGCVEESEPLVNLADYDHVAEASVDFPSGQLVIAGNSDYWPDTARIEIDAGTLSSNGLEGNDVYTIVLWPAPASQAVVLKGYKAM